MSEWVIKGLVAGIRTTVYPKAPERAPGTTPGFPAGGEFGRGASELASRCPTGALAARGGTIDVDERRCIHCYRCVRGVERPLGWDRGYEWATQAHSREGLATGSERPALGRPYRKSIHVIVVDAGDCGACLNEVRQLNNPYYNMHRLGFFVTPTPRHADVLLVVGPVTDHMRVALRKIYDAMPTPKCVVAVGACALSGGVFAGSFTCKRGVADVLPVEVEVPGNPPPPLAILHGLLVAAGRAAPARRRGVPEDGEATAASRASAGAGE
ncbi:MAG: NADH:ubiquinone oxidoreductase [Proteobacteria bacterium]|jgi:Ni,Fe-hydrogenase III small subunit|nr:NADH:ubiquinone oxidoreductase [Pseudomonadota bacterium]